MRQVFPQLIDPIDVEDCYISDARRAAGQRPWVAVNMVASPDGATARTGRSAGLSSPADRMAFHALRASADYIVVGARTATAENYGPPLIKSQFVDRRAQRGQQPFPQIVIVTARAAFSPTARVFSDQSMRPIIATISGHAPAVLAPLREVAEVMEFGSDRVELGLLLDLLGQRGGQTVLVEGGPTLNGELIAANLVDEWCLTLGATLVAGNSARAAHGTIETPPEVLPMKLVRVIESDGNLLLRYVRADSVAS